MNNAPLFDIVQSNEIIELLKNIDAQEFLTRHFNEKPDYLALTYSGKVSFDLTKLTQILHLYQKAKTKIPLWVENRCAMHHKSYAQCSHWKLAQFKSSLFSGNRLLDLTSGLGVDAFYFSKSFKSVTCLEPDLTTYQFAKYNGEKLKVDNIDYLNIDIESFQLVDNYDAIYLDPDRRDLNEARQKNIESYSPNILDWHVKLLEHSNHVIIKLSPMIDITFLETMLPKLFETYVISYKNEVKEVLIHMANNTLNSSIRHAVDIGENETSIYTRTNNSTRNSSNVIGRFLLEPSKALIKAGLAVEYCHGLGLHPCNKNGLYFISNDDVPGFIGRRFEIISQLDVNWTDIRKYLKATGLASIQITQRHFFDNVKTIRQKLKIKEGGNTFLQFTTDDSGNALCYHTKLWLD